MLVTPKLIVDELRKTLCCIFVPPPFVAGNLNYSDYWSKRIGEGTSGLKARHFILSRFIEPGSSVLDLGCGDGTFCEFLAHWSLDNKGRFATVQLEVYLCDSWRVNC